jgi:predicted ATP-dependent Lon-type protease
VPSDNKCDLAEIPDDLLGALNVVFYQDPLNAAVKSIGLE